MYVHMHTYVHARTHARAQHAHAHTHTYTHNTHKHIHTHTHIHTTRTVHTHTYTHTRPRTHSVAHKLFSIIPGEGIRCSNSVCTYYVFVCMNVYVHACVSLQFHICAHTIPYIHYIYVCMIICFTGHRRQTQKTMFFIYQTQQGYLHFLEM